MRIRHGTCSLTKCTILQDTALEVHMMRPWFVAATAALMVTAVGSTDASAQSVSADVSQHASACDDAAARLNSNTLPRVGAPGWSDWVALTGCGSRGATLIAGALRSDGIRTETELNRLDHLAGILDGWFQPQLVNAYEALLRSPDASNAVRLRAMWLLSGLYVPNVDVAGPLQGYMSLRCETYDRSTALRDAPETLPSTVYEEAEEAMAYVADDRSAPEYVRSTARCWNGVIREALRNGTTGIDDRYEDRRDDRTTTVVVERPVRVVYECDNRFVFYNDAGYDLAVRYAGYGSGGVLRVTHGGPYVWVAGRFGPVRFYVGEREVYYSPAVYRPCGRTRVVMVGSVHPWGGWHSGLGVYVGIRNGHRVIAPRVVFAPRIVIGRPPVIVVPRGRDRDWNDRRDDRSWNDPRRNDRNDRDNRSGRNDRNDRCCGERDDRGGRVGGDGRRDPRGDNRPSDNGASGGRGARGGNNGGNIGGNSGGDNRGGNRGGRDAAPDQPRIAVPKGRPQDATPGRVNQSEREKVKLKHAKGSLGDARGR